MTGETITDPGRAQGTARRDPRRPASPREQDEAVIGEGALASPVFDSWGAAVGAIGVVVPPVRRTHDPGDLVRETARALSRELGASSWPPPQT